LQIPVRIKVKVNEYYKHLPNLDVNSRTDKVV